MGMYTELICGCTLRKDTPKIFVDSMFWLLNNTQGKESPEITKFIDNYDLSRILFSDSYYFGAPSNCIFKYDKIGDNYELSIRSNLKNYEGQIEKFLDYITPYVEDGSGTKNIFAMVLYEEDEFPTLYTVDGKYEFNDKKLEDNYNIDINAVNHLEDYSKSDISEEKKEILNYIINLWKRDLVTD